MLSSFFPRDILDENLDLIESVFDGFSIFCYVNEHHFKLTQRTINILYRDPYIHYLQFRYGKITYEGNGAKLQTSMHFAKLVFKPNVRNYISNQHQLH